MGSEFRSHWSTDYELGAEISSAGADGVIRRAFRKGRPGIACHVLKFVHRSTDAGGHDEMKQYREATVLKRLNHDNIVKLLGIYDSRSFLYAMAFPEADTDLQQMLRRREEHCLPDNMATEVAKQLRNGLAYVHQADILHRDLKPANVLVFLDDPPRYVIADFSRARGLEARATRCRGKQAVTSSGASLANAAFEMTVKVCTPQYQAPETVCEDSCQIAEFYGFSSDAWSYGCVVFAVLSGRHFMETPPGDAKSFVRACAARLGRPPPASRFPESETSPLPATVSMAEALSGRSESAMDFVTKLLRWVPHSRMTLQAAANHPWLACAGKRPSEPASAASPGAFQIDVSEPSGRLGKRRRCALGSVTKIEPGSEARGSVLDSDSAASLGACEMNVAESSGHEKERKETKSEKTTDCQLGSPAPGWETTAGRKRCECSRRCKQPGHSRQGPGCKSKDLVRGSSLCSLCVCRVKPCLRPRFNGPRCYMHEQLYSTLSWPMQATHCLGSAAEDCFPADVTDFLHHLDKVGKSVVGVVFVALLKEPSATKIFTRGLDAQSCATASSDAWRQRLVSVAREVSASPTYVREAKQLSRQGVCRFCGTMRTCAVFGVTKKAGAGSPSDPENRTTLGVRGNAFDVQQQDTGGRFQQFYDVTEAAQETWLACLSQKDPEKLIKDIESLVGKLKIGEYMQGSDATCYVAKFVARKMLMACWQIGAMRTAVKWNVGNSQTGDEPMGVSAPPLHPREPRSVTYLSNV